jgi:hypothetical protein
VDCVWPLTHTPQLGRQTPWGPQHVLVKHLKPGSQSAVELQTSMSAQSASFQQKQLPSVSRSQIHTGRGQLDEPHCGKVPQLPSQFRPAGQGVGGTRQGLEHGRRPREGRAGSDALDDLAPRDAAFGALDTGSFFHAHSSPDGKWVALSMAMRWVDRLA